MDENQKYFILTIVGAPQRLVLGRQLRFDQDPATLPRKPAGGLSRFRLAVLQRWENSKRQFAPRSKGVAVEANATQAVQAFPGPKVVSADQHPQTVAISTTGFRPVKYLVWALPSVALLGVAIYAASTWRSEFEMSSQSVSVVNKKQTGADVLGATQATAPGLPIERASSIEVSGGGVTVVDSPAPASPLPLGGMPTPGLPLDRKVATVVLTPASPNQTPAQSLAKATAPVEKQKEERVDRAVIVDERKVEPTSPEPPTAQAVKPAQAQSAPKPEQPPPATRTFAMPTEVKAAAPAAPTASRPQAPDKVTLVDVAPDASYVLITNPKTRLPVRYSTGQKIFTGETIKSIDPKAGTVVLDSRTVVME